MDNNETQLGALAIMCVTLIAIAVLTVFAYLN
jgi:hypothetical protein